MGIVATVVKQYVNGTANVEQSKTFSDKANNVRSSNSSFETGDLFQIPDPDADDFIVFIAPVGGTTTTNTMESVIVPIVRSRALTAGNLFSGFFRKNRQAAVETEDGTVSRLGVRASSGEVVVAYNRCATLMDFFRENKGKWVKVVRSEIFKSPRYVPDNYQTTPLVPSCLQDTWVPTLTWADAAASKEADELLAADNA